MTTIILNDGNKIPAVGFGVFLIPADGPTYDAVRTALDAGYRHIDTAAAYFNEADVGRAVRDSGIPREEIFVTSKVAAEHKSYATAAQSIQKPAVPAFRLTWFKATPPFLSEPAGRTGPFRRRRST